MAAIEGLSCHHRETADKTGNLPTAEHPHPERPATPKAVANVRDAGWYRYSQIDSIVEQAAMAVGRAGPEFLELRSWQASNRAASQPRVGSKATIHLFPHNVSLSGELASAR